MKKALVMVLVVVFLSRGITPIAFADGHSDLGKSTDGDYDLLTESATSGANGLEVVEDPSPCSKDAETKLNPSDKMEEKADAHKAVALVLASDDFHSLHQSLIEDGLHFDAGQHRAFRFGGCSGCEEHQRYVVAFGFSPLATGNSVGIIASVDLSAEKILDIERVDLC